VECGAPVGQQKKKKKTILEGSGGSIDDVHVDHGGEKGKGGWKDNVCCCRRHTSGRGHHLISPKSGDVTFWRKRGISRGQHGKKREKVVYFFARGGP